MIIDDGWWNECLEQWQQQVSILLNEFVILLLSICKRICVQKNKMNNNFRSSFHFEFKWDSYYRLLSICPSRIQLHNTLFFVVFQLRTKMCTQWFSNCGHKSMLHPCVLPYMHGSMQRTQRREREKWRWLHCRVDILARNTRAYSLIQQVTTTQMRIWLFFLLPIITIHLDNFIISSSLYFQSILIPKHGKNPNSQLPKQ